MFRIAFNYLHASSNKPHLKYGANKIFLTITTFYYNFCKVAIFQNSQNLVISSISGVFGTVFFFKQKTAYEM